MSREKEEEFKRGKHVKYFLRCINALPMAYKAMDTSRLVICFLHKRRIQNPVKYQRRSFLQK